MVTPIPSTHTVQDRPKTRTQPVRRQNKGKLNTTNIHRAKISPHKEQADLTGLNSPTKNLNKKQVKPIRQKPTEKGSVAASRPVTMTAERRPNMKWSHLRWESWHSATLSNLNMSSGQPEKIQNNDKWFDEECKTLRQKLRNPSN